MSRTATPTKDELLAFLRGLDSRLATLERRNNTYPFEAAVVSNTALQVIGSGAPFPGEAVVWGEEVLDNAGFWQPGVPTRLTFPRDGFYLVGGGTLWAVGTVGQRRTDIQHNNAADGILAYPDHDLKPGHASIIPTNKVVTVIEATEGDYVRLMVTQDSGASQNLLFPSRFWAIRIA